MPSMSEEPRHHMVSFAEAFVLPARKDRWIGILSNHKPKNLKHSAKLYDHIDRQYWVRNDHLEGVSVEDAIGVFYDFYDTPRVISFSEATKLGQGIDAIFSLKAGRYAVLFFHEHENYVLSK